MSAVEHQKLLLAELQHRVRNMLAVIRSIIRRTGESSESVEVGARVARRFEPSGLRCWLHADDTLKR